MTCGGCGNSDASKTQSGFVKSETGQRIFSESCEKCGFTGNVWLPDVYFDGKPEENLADGQDGKPRVFSSKRDKAIYLKQQGIVEAGDTVRGAPISSMDKSVRKDPFSRERIAESRAQVKKMGVDFRRQEVLRIIKESERYAKAS